MQKELVQIESEVANQKKEKAMQFLKYAEGKFKSEKKEKGVFGIFSEKKNIFQEVTSFVKGVVGSESKDTHHNDPSNPTHENGEKKLTRGESIVFQGGVTESTKRRDSKRPTMAGSQVASALHANPNNLGSFRIIKYLPIKNLIIIMLLRIKEYLS